MIVDVPDHQEIQETAIGWLNLAWEIIIEALGQSQESWVYNQE